MINEIWEGLRLLPFFVTETGDLRWKTGVKDSGHAPPHPRPYDGPCFCRISAPSVPPGRAAWPAPPSRPGAIAPRRVPCGGLLAVLGTKKECGGMKIARLARAAPRRALAPGAGGCRGLVVWGRARRGPSPVCPGQFSPPPEARGAQPPRPGSRQSWGPGLGALRAARRAVWPFPPWRLCGRWGRFCRPGWGGQPLACPGPSPLGGL